MLKGVDSSNIPEYESDPNYGGMVNPSSKPYSRKSKNRRKSSRHETVPNTAQEIEEYFTGDTLDEEHLLLTPPTVYGFSLQDKQWCES